MVGPNCQEFKGGALLNMKLWDKLISMPEWQTRPVEEKQKEFISDNPERMRGIND